MLIAYLALLFLVNFVLGPPIVVWLAESWHERIRRRPKLADRSKNNE